MLSIQVTVKTTVETMILPCCVVGRSPVVQDDCPPHWRSLSQTVCDTSRLTSANTEINYSLKVATEIIKKLICGLLETLKSTHKVNLHHTNNNYYMDKLIHVPISMNFH